MIVLKRNSEIPEPLPDGFVVLIDKEAGCTSFDVVAKMRKILKIKKIGHAGTLDPFATGLLILLVGKATKIQDSLMLSDKVYEAEIKLGERTDSFDKTGKIIAESDKRVSEEEIRAAVMSFKGEQLQLPPMFSALKKDGKRLYELARKGIEVEREPRKIIIHSIDILECLEESIRIRVHCSKGTYIRTLADDIGTRLGTYAYLKELRRTAVGEHNVEDSLKTDEFRSKISGQ
ncbi:MAG: tRNA pseudouridine(55) synthase TruB [Candidatus Delongbacteria bacterium]|nr:tRNA pseudouridine(55) synthase TruB [Candidatus Delongbacteria bacterium]